MRLPAFAACIWIPLMSDMCSFFAFKCWDSPRLLFLVLVASFLALVLVLVLLRRHTTPRRLLPLPSRVVMCVEWWVTVRCKKIGELTQAAAASSSPPTFLPTHVCVTHWPVILCLCVHPHLNALRMASY